MESKSFTERGFGNEAEFDYNAHNVHCNTHDEVRGCLSKVGFLKNSWKVYGKRLHL